MKTLIVGAGVIGTVYGAQLACAGHAVFVLDHPPGTESVARYGLRAQDVLTGQRLEAAVSMVSDPADQQFDLVLVAVRSDQLAPVLTELAGLRGSPTIVRPLSPACRPLCIAAQTTKP